MPLRRARTAHGLALTLLLSGCVPPGSALDAPSGLRAVALATGRQSHSCAVLEDGTVRCWGPNNHGQLGDGARISRARPVAVPGLRDVVAAAVGGRQTCALQRSGAVVCWGDDAPGLRTVTGLHARALALGEEHACAIAAEGGVDCWHGGANASRVGGTGDAVAIAAAWQHTCILERAGTVYCWPEAGVAEGPPPDDPNSPDLHDVVAIDTSYERSCVVRRGGALACWRHGSNWDDKGRYRDAPLEEVPWARGAVAIAMGHDTSLALLRSGEVAAWGRGWSGEYGDGHASRSKDGVSRVRGLEHVKQVVAGRHSCALDASGAVFCWGSNDGGGLGVARPDVVATPVEVPGISDAQRVVAGSGYTCVLRRTGKVACWGAGFNRSIFYDHWDLEPERAFEPADVPGIDGATAIRGGRFRVCAAVPGGPPLCFEGGHLPPGIEADPRIDRRYLPRPLPGLDSLRAADVYSGVTMRADDAGVVWWSSNEGKWHRGTTFEGVASISAAEWVLYGVTPRGAVLCARVRLKDEADPARAFRVEGIEDAASVVGQGTHGAYIVHRDGKVSFVRDPLDEEASCAPSYVRIPGLEGVVEVAADGAVACAILSTGRIKCWGDGADGQLGDGTVRKKPFDEVPFARLSDVQGIDDAVSIAVGQTHACAVRRSGKVMCWGRNDGDQAGREEAAVSFVPLRVRF